VLEPDLVVLAPPANGVLLPVDVRPPQEPD
jgi:hypothetical protein